MFQITKREVYDFKTNSDPQSCFNKKFGRRENVVRSLSLAIRKKLQYERMHQEVQA
jgi:hypothetical protein